MYLFKNNSSRHENTTQLIKQQGYGIKKIRNQRLKDLGRNIEETSNIG